MILIPVFLLAVFLVCALKSEETINNESAGGEKYAQIGLEFSGLLDTFDEHGLTRLMLAAKTGQLEPLKNYIAGGANIHLETADKDTALLLAVKGGFYYTSMELIHAKSHLNHRNINGMTPLLLAVVGGHSDIAIGIIDGGADPNMTNADGSSVLVIAAQTGLKVVVESLIRHGAVLDSTSEGGDTALMFASASGHEEIVRLLLEKGARSDISNQRDYTALMFAATRGHAKVIEAIVQHERSSLSARDRMNRAALDHAIASNRQQAVDALVALGADLPRSGYRVSAEVWAKREAYLKELSKPAAASHRVKHASL